MRRLLLIAALLAALVPTPASSGPLDDLPGEPWRAKECRYMKLNGKSGFTDWEIKVTIRCAVAHFPVAGGVDRAFCYAAHESGFNEFAANPYSSASGVFQTIDGTWDHIRGRHPKFIRHWSLRTDGPGRHAVYHGRTHVVLVMRYVNAVGWGAWSNYASYTC